jgi:predicted phage terminase large subunit-like protein
MKLLSQEESDEILRLLPQLPLKEQESLLKDLDKLNSQMSLNSAKDDFLAFCLRVYPGFKTGPHHRFLRPILHRVLLGTELRVCVSMPPRFGKSETIAYLFVAWYLGHNPSHQVIMVTHTTSLSDTFGRKVRDLIDTPQYREIFPDTVVSRDKSAAGNWNTTLGGKYLAIGIGANVAGYGADLLIADDLISENAMLANPDAAFDNAWTYCMVGPLQRLMPGGRIVMIGCVTAETRVLMADGLEKEMQHIKVGDLVATYDAGSVVFSRVLNWIEHRPDFVYKIRTTSGTIVRANKRHPFLVDRNGARSWVRVRDLKVGDCLVRAVQQKGASGQGTPKDCAVPATKTKRGLKERLGQLLKPRRGQKQRPKLATSCLSDTGGSGKVSSVPSRGVTALFQQRGYVTVATARHCGVQVSTASLLSKSVAAILNTGMAFLRKLTTLSLQNKVGFAQSASSYQQERTQGQDKIQNCTLTTATTQTESEDFCVTTATLQSAGEKRQTYLKPLPDTYAITPDAIVEIVEDGFEPVFDMEVERTENFIANGVVSHNTRWGKKDPIGRALKWAEENPTSPQWLEVRFPAILPSGKSLWPEQWPIEQLIAKKASMAPQYWNAQYQQTPTVDEGALIKREWWKIWDKKDPPDVEFVIQAWDTAHESKNSADFSACTTWGVWQNLKRESNIILLNAIRGRWEFPELKKVVLEQWKEWKPESLVIEKKAAGAPLIQELRRMDIVVQETTPSRGTAAQTNDKRARMNAIADIFSSGKVWAPDRRWAYEVIDEVAEFPAGEHDDYADTCQMAMARYRAGGFIKLPSDYDYEEEEFKPKRRLAYY